MSPTVFDLGLVSFAQARQKQLEVFKCVSEGRIPSALIFCRHHPVITLGRRADANNIIAQPGLLSQKNIEILRIERGGEVTYHGPGQLTAYPIFNLNFFKKDLHWFLRRLEEAIIGCLSGLGVAAVARPGLTGVWVGDKKIASIGISVRKWTTFHGLSINVEEGDTPGFSLIRPCGMDIKMTSLEQALGKKTGFDHIKSGLTRRFELCVI